MLRHQTVETVVRARTHTFAYVVLGALLCGAALLPTAARAQSQTTDMALSLGTGFLHGGRDPLVSAHMSPIFIDASAFYYTDEEVAVALGGSLRFETEKSGGVAIVPRAQLRTTLGKLQLRPGIGVPFFAAPKTMLGPEVSVAGRWPLGHNLGLLGQLLIDAFLIGSDVPKNQSVMMFNLTFGVELEL